MHDVLRQRVLRRLESLPEDQLYQVLDYIEFLESKYARELAQEASGLQKFAENLEDRLRRKAVNPANLREAFQLIAAADRVLSQVSRAGKDLLEELAPVPGQTSGPRADLEGLGEGGEPGADGSGTGGPSRP